MPLLRDPAPERLKVDLSQAHRLPCSTGHQHDVLTDARHPPPDGRFGFCGTALKQCPLLYVRGVVCFCVETGVSCYDLYTTGPLLIATLAVA